MKEGQRGWGTIRANSLPGSSVILPVDGSVLTASCILYLFRDTGHYALVANM
jgi:hypothetical protein